MGLFSKRAPQEAFHALDFTISDTLFDPPRWTFLPSIYQDSVRKKWAVKYRSADPVVFDYADILTCEVIESGDAAEAKKIDKREFAHQIVANPARAVRINAAKRGMCLGMGVIVAVQTEENEISKLEIPVLTKEVKRDSAMYRSCRSVADGLKKVFDIMMLSAQET